jgi:hypothetical protein
MTLWALAGFPDCFYPALLAHMGTLRPWISGMESRDRLWSHGKLLHDISGRKALLQILPMMDTRLLIVRPLFSSEGRELPKGGKIQECLEWFCCWCFSLHSSSTSLWFVPPHGNSWITLIQSPFRSRDDQLMLHAILRYALSIDLLGRPVARDGSGVE